MSTPKFKLNAEIKNQDNQQQEDIINQNEMNIENINDQFLNEKAVDIESLAHRVFGANPAILNVKGEAYILHADGTKTFLKPEDLNKVHLAEGDVIVTAPEAKVIIEAAEKQCVIDGNNQLLIDKALLSAINPANGPCPGTELLENEGHSHELVMSEHWQVGEAIALFGTLSGEYPGFFTSTFSVNDLLTLSDLFNLRGGQGEEAPVSAPIIAREAAPVIASAPAATVAPPVPFDDGNDAPFATDSFSGGGEDQTLVFSLSMFNSTDGDMGDTVDSVIINSIPTNGSLMLLDPISGTASPVTAGQIISANDINNGNLQFIPPTNESGDDSFSTAGIGDQLQDYANFSFSVSDGTEISNAANMAINIMPIADAPLEDTVTPQPQQEFNPLYLASGNNAGTPDGTSIYSVEFNSATDEAELTLVYNTATQFPGNFLSDAQMAVTEDGSRIYLLDTNNGGGAPEIGYYDTTTQTFNVTSLNAAGLDAGAMTFFADNTGQELLYIADKTTHTLTSYDVNTGNQVIGFGTFALLDPVTGNPTGGIYNFDGGDIVFDEFGQAYAVSNSLTGNTGGLAILNLENQTATLLQEFNDWNVSGGSAGLRGVTSLHYDEATQQFSVGISNVLSNTYQGGAPVGSVFITLDKNGNYIDATNPTVDMTLNGANFNHSAGDTGSAVTAEYVVPLTGHLVDNDGSEALLAISIDFNDSVDGIADGAAIVYNGQVVVDGGQVFLDSNLGVGTVQATASVDPTGQIWTFTVNSPNSSVTDLSGDFALRVGLAQGNDFTVNTSFTTIELSNGDTATTTTPATIPVNFIPEITDGAALIIHDEDSGNQPGTNDVDFTVLPGAINAMESTNTLAGPRLGAAHTPMGELAYKAPGGDYITDIGLVQANGQAFSGQDSGILTGGNHIFLYQGADNNMLIGRVGSGVGGLTPNPTGAVIFAIHLDSGQFDEFGSPNDSLWLSMYQGVDNALAPAQITNLIHLQVTSNDGDVVTSAQSINVRIFENDNDAPVTSNSSFTIGEDISRVLTLADFPSTDADVGDLVDGVRINTLPTSGTLEFFNIGLNAWVPVTAGQVITSAQMSAGRLRYTNDLHESGDDSFNTAGTGDQLNDYSTFTYSVTDGQAFSNISTMRVDVIPIADAPTMGAGIVTQTKTFSTVYLSDAGPIIANPDFPDPSTNNEQASLGGSAVAGAALYTLSFNDNGTPNDITDDTVDLVFVDDFWSLQNPNANPAFLNQRVDGRLENPLNPLAGGVQQDPDNDPGDRVGNEAIANDIELSDVGYTSAAIAAVLDGTQIFALDDARVDGSSRLDFGFLDTTTNSFTNISGPDLDAYTPDGVGHATNSTTGAQGMTFFGGGGQQQIFVYNIATDQVQSFDISTSLTTGSNPFAPANQDGTFGATGGLGFKIISSVDRTGAGPDLRGAGPDANGDGYGDNPDGIGDNPDGIGDYVGMYYDMSGGDIIFDQYDQAYMISNSRENVNALGGSNQVGGFAKLNLEDGTAELLNDFRDQFNFYNDFDPLDGQNDVDIAHGVVGVGGLFLDAGANSGDGLFYISVAGAQRFTEDGTKANDKQVSSAFLVVDRNGNFVTFQDMTILDPITGQSVPFTHAGGGDGTNSLQTEYTLPIIAGVTDADLSEALTQLKLSVTDSIVGDPVDGAVLRFDNANVLDAVTNTLLINQVDLDIDGDGVSDGVLATISYDALSQTYTLTLDPNDAVQNINNNQFSFTANGNQTTDFTMTVEATSTELSNGDSATGSYDVFVNRSGDPVIDAVGSITIDETSGVQTSPAGIDDVATTTLNNNPADPYADVYTAFNTMETGRGIAGTMTDLAHTLPGEFKYIVPNSFAGDVTFTDFEGFGFNGIDTGLVAQTSGKSIFLWTLDIPPAPLDADQRTDHFLLGREGTDPFDSASGNIIFALYYDAGLDQFGAANDTLWLSMYQNIDNPGGADVAIQDLIYLTVTDASGTTANTSSQSITVTFIDDPADPDSAAAAAAFSSFSLRSADPVSTDDASSNSFMTVSNDDSLTMSTVSNDDPSTINDSSSQNQSSATTDSSANDGQALTNDMVFSTESSQNPTQAEQQAALDGTNSSTQQEVAQQQQAQTTEPAPSAPDAIAQSMQDADQQAQSSSGG